MLSPLKSFFAVAGLAVLLLASACTSSSERTAEEPPPQDQTTEPSPPIEPDETEGADGSAAPSAPAAQAVRGFIAEALEPRSDLTVEEARQRLGSPQRVETDTTQNRHVPAQTDTLRTLVYDGVEVQFYEVSQSGDEMLSHIRLNADRYEGPEGLHTGLGRQAVRDRRGAPDRTENGNFIYEIGDPAPTVLTVSFEEDTVSQLEWAFYID